jgi:hypothetical protein
MENQKIVNGVSYNVDTPDNLIWLLECLYKSRQRVHIYYGEPKTLTYWGDKTTGRIGKSTGNVKILISVYNARSLGGSAISTDRILKITYCKGGAVLYERQNENV